MEQIAELVAALDTFLAQSVGEAATRLARELFGPIKAGLTIAVLWFGIGAAYGWIRQPLFELAQKGLIIGLVTEIALHGGLYAQEIIPAVLAAGDGLAAALLPGDPAGAAQIVTAALTLVVDTVKQLWAKAGVFSGEGLAFLLAGFLFTICAALTLGLGLAFLLVAKVSTAILLAIGPLCIASILFRPVSWLFDSWVRNLMNFALLGALFSAALSLFASLYGSYFAGAAVGQVDITEAMVLVLIVSAVAVLVMLQIPALCSSLVGGAALSISRPVHQLASAAAFGKAAAVATGRGTVAVGRGAARGAVVVGQAANRTLSYNGGSPVPTGTGATAKALARASAPPAKPSNRGVTK